MKKRFLGWLAAGATFGLPGTMAAADDSSVKIRAFGSVGYSVLTSSHATNVDEITGVDPTTQLPVFGQESVKPKSYDGAGKGGTWQRNTHFGLNVTGSIAPNLTMTLGLIVMGANLEDGTAQDFTMRANVASLRYEPIANVAIQVGRMAAPLWLISEEKYVGLTYPWLRPPLEVYEMASPNESLDGIRLTYTANFGDLTIRPSAVVGNYPVTQVDTGTYRGGGGVLDLEYSDWLTVHTTYQVASGTTTIASSSQDTVKDSAGQTVPVTVPVVATLSGRVSFLNIGVRATPGRVLFMAERAAIVFKNIQGTGATAPYSHADYSQNAYYATLGYNIGRFLPRFTYATTKGTLGSFDRTDIYKSSVAPLPAALQPRMQRYLINQSTLPATSTSMNLGVNYQINPGSVLKLEYQTSRAYGDESGYFGLQPGASVATAQAGIDFAL